ncbi:adenosylcobinamide-phosphate synthase CbiB [Tepidiforma thermophila]|uniref:Cobalamin biosynthesis protein CobD n=1 Tax=Tepidiforma thermophila (strain KCTC 52669 / CGMCC 1.13589 / G233) TaxID=2761530 RepID=A0A2A9HIT1_TEPT2|nr:adenosylcobinamide-phosphate synthase CbiB [Tepidiforma thermophila]PFG75040.1 adenosylcobinamide-phosphate synthase [Tepidiforma thermophila]
MIRRRAAVLGAAAVVDLAMGELPNRWHPVALFGRAAGCFDRLLTSEGRRDTATRGVLLTATAVGLALGAAMGVVRAAWGRGAAGFVLEALALKQTLAIRALFGHAGRVADAVEAGDLAGARAAAAMMVSRRTDDLPPGLVASAAIESLAENLSDSVVAPAWWYLAAGLPGAAAYRAVNALDAMVGYRSRGRFGMVPARLDDVLNWLPARLTAASLVLVRPLPGARQVRRLVRDARSTSSPNAGWPMAAMAHVLGVRLEKLEHHVLHGAGREPGAADIRRAQRTGALALAAMALAGATMCWRIDG